VTCDCVAEVVIKSHDVASFATEVVMVQSADLTGSIQAVLPVGVRYLDPEPAVFEAMLEGWTRQQHSRMLRETTIGERARLVRRFAEFTGQYPWQWTPSEVEAFISELRSGPKPVAFSTVRGYQTTLRLFVEFVTDPRYGWPADCQTRFGTVPSQICHEWNTVTHSTEFEGQPARRALTYDELQVLFDAADDRVAQIRERGRKGSLPALRDAALLKTVYAFGLRRREASMLDVADWRRNPRAGDYGRFGAVQVRYGKAVKGAPPRRRTVLTVPEMDWIVEVLQHWVGEVRAQFDPGGHAAMWMTERRGRIAVRTLDEAFAEIRSLAGLPAELDLHCLRHSYVTHLLEFGYPELFVQQQVGHSYASTTAIYSSVGDEFRNRLLEQSLQRQIKEGTSR
jgi:site-specific recombinase XerD